MKTVIAVAILAMLFGCSHKDYNTMVMAQNNERLQAYGKAMSIQTTEGGRLAIALTYALGVGRQQLSRDETALDYMKAFVPYANMLMPFAYGAWNGDENRSSMSAGRDIYVNSTRADSSWLYHSSSQEYTLANGSSATSNDQASGFSPEANSSGTSDDQESNGSVPEVPVQ